jgi:hypothetical protein
MSWMPNLEHRATVDRSALGDTMLSILRRALVLVGVGKTADDITTAVRAINEAGSLLRTVRQMYPCTSLQDAQDARVCRGIELLSRAVEAAAHPEK